MTDTERRSVLTGLAAIATGTTVAVGWLSWPIHTDLYSVAFENWRSERVELEVELAANGVRVHRSTVELARKPDRVVLPCAWSRPALSYRLAVRPPWTEEWHTARFRGEGTHCSVVKLRPDDAVSEVIDFENTVPCPPNTAGPDSCE